MIAEGIYTDLSSEDYHGDKESISRSGLMDFDKSPYNYWAKHLNRDRPIKESTPAMILGSAFHAMVLEPFLFNNIYAITPPKLLLKDVGRDIYEIFKNEYEILENSGKILLSPNDFDILTMMASKIGCNKNARELISSARIEESFFWYDFPSGLMLKCRPDILHENMIVDLKTCSDASPRAFQRSMVDYGYHIQGSMIRDAVEILEGRRINSVINICIETKYPYNMGIYIIDEAALDEGHMKYKQLCLDLKHAITYNEFRDYGVMTIGLPKWAF